MEFFFGEHHLDVDRRELRRGAELIAVEPRVLDLLVYLVQNRERVVSKDDLIATVWGGRIVSESTVTSHIHAARKAVDDSGEAQCLIRTVPRKGVRFTGVVREGAARPPATASLRPPFELSDEAPTAVRTEAAAPAYLPSTPRPRLSISVLPFTSFSDDREQQYFADAITDDLTTDLSRAVGMFVISRSTAFTYKNKPLDAKQIGRELGVRYVLEGSVRRSDDLVRVNAQLIDAETDQHLWAERFDRKLGDLFALQNEITGRIAVAINLELIDAEAARPTSHPDALDCILRGRAAGYKPSTRDSRAEAIGWFERALTLDPHSIDARSLLAGELAARVLNSFAGSAVTDLARAEALASQALLRSPRSLLAHFAKGQVLRAKGRLHESIPEYETVIAINRNWATAIYALSHCRLLTGSIDETIPLIEQAIRLSPRDPFVANWYGGIGRVHLVQSRIDEAIPWFERARSANPGLVSARAFLAASYALRDETERAAAELAEVRRLSGGGYYSSITRLRETGYFGVPEVLALFETTFFAGLRKAGVPED
jgi:TolB-like protein